MTNRIKNDSSISRDSFLCFSALKPRRTLHYFHDTWSPYYYLCAYLIRFNLRRPINDETAFYIQVGATLETDAPGGSHGWDE